MAKKRSSTHKKSAVEVEARAPILTPDDPDLSMIAESLRNLVVPVGNLVLDPANARTHGEKNLDALRGSLAVYGQLKPVVVRKDNSVVVAGNGTLQAALSLGWTHLAVVFVDMDAATAAGFSIADNRTAELADWDSEALGKLLREVRTDNDERLDRMLAELAEGVGVIALDDREANSDGNQDTGQADIQQQFGVIVMCADEAAQREVYERLTGEGLNCKVVVV